MSLLGESGQHVPMVNKLVILSLVWLLSMADKLVLGQNQDLVKTLQFVVMVSEMVESSATSMIHLATIGATVDVPMLVNLSTILSAKTPMRRIMVK